MIDLKNLSFLYGDGEEETARTQESGIAEIELAVAPGTCVLLCGGSGCGKTTLTKAVNGLIPHFEGGRLTGKAVVDGQDTQTAPMYQLAKSVASVFQNPKSQFFNTDAESEITFSLENQGVPVAEIDRRLAAAVKALGLEPLLKKSLFQMSGGEKQIVAFAGAYISGAKVAVLDEPSANLDPGATQKIRAIIEKMKTAGQTILIAEHRISYLQGVVDTVCYMEQGKITRRCTAVAFYSMPDKERVALGLRQLQEMRTIQIQAADLPNAPRTKNVFEVRELALAYGKSIVAEHLSFTLRAGDIVGITGQNGAGKSTLSRVLCGLHRQKSGEILLNGKTLGIRKRRCVCGIVMQDVNYQLFSDSVRGECLLGNAGAAGEKIDRILTELGLAGLAGAHPQSLSGGQKQRLAIAAALASDKKVLILDEPTSGLDYKNMMVVSRLLARLARQGILCIVITHDAEFLASACNRCLRLDAQGMAEIKEFSAEQFTR